MRPRRIKIIPGMRFGRLTVIAEAPMVLRNRDPVRAVSVVCECGRKLVVRLYNISSGNTLSCGCGRDRDKWASHPQPPGGETVAAYCRRVGISRNTFYNRLRMPAPVPP